jgi:hypothetical protein
VDANAPASLTLQEAIGDLYRRDADNQEHADRIQAGLVRALQDLSHALSKRDDQIAEQLVKRIDAFERSDSILDGLTALSLQLSSLSERLNLIESKLESRGTTRTVERDRQGHITKIVEQ